MNKCTTKFASVIIGTNYKLFLTRKKCLVAFSLTKKQIRF